MSFTEGDPALLIDSKGREFLLSLEPGRTFQFHRGTLTHDELLAADDGSWHVSSGGAKLLLLSPRLADFIIRMKRGAQVVYPKDIGPILVYGDIGTGMTVLEAGTGSGALTMALARAVGPEGRVISIDRREDHLEHANKTFTRWLGGLPENLELRVADVVDVVAELKPERIVLDMPEPWHAIREGAEHQPDGGVLTAYLPTVPQVQTAVEAARDTRRYQRIEVREFLSREWNVDGRSVRPAHGMVGHTGFLIFMRKTADETQESGQGN